MLQSLVELEVEMCEPQFAVFRLALLRHRLNDFTNLLQVSPPKLSVVQQVDVHELVDHLDCAAMHIAKLPVLCDQGHCLGLHLLVVLLDLNRVIPCDLSVIDASGTLWILDQVFKLSDLVDHHRLLAGDHLCAHGIEEVSRLL